MTWLSLRITAEQAMTTVSLHFSRLTGVSLIPDWCGRLAAGLIHRLCPILPSDLGLSRLVQVLLFAIASQVTHAQTTLKIMTSLMMASADLGTRHAR